MQTQRGQEARKIRAEGDKEARRIHADADMQQRVILAEARNTAEVTRGQGDGEAQRLYNDTFGKDPQFFDFWRSMMAMQRALPKENTTFIGSPDGDFFRYFYSQSGAAPVSGGVGAGAPAKP
jgi:membrane protease subunit HflC